MTTASGTPGLPWRLALTAAALAGCAGAIDLLAVLGLRGAFASVVTGNLVTAGGGIAAVNVTTMVPPLSAVAGYAAGVVVWLRVWRGRPGAIRGPLVLEGVFLAGVAAGWMIERGHLQKAPAVVLLVIAAMAMGGQSVIALRLHAATTYLTGTLTDVLHDLVDDRPGLRAAAFRQLGSLVIGAVVAGIVLIYGRWAAALVPLALLSLAVWACQAPSPARSSG
jgi:uncharacterized membrane protein YoaK (UPF0700 family)